jgi:Zn-dependent M28 family amino/carboxypeptidase
MKGLLILFLIFNFSSKVYSRAPGSYSTLKSELQKVSSKNLVDWVNSLVKESSPSRMVGLPGHDKAQNHIRSTILKLDQKKSGKLILQSTPPMVELVKSFYQNDFDQKIAGKLPSTHPDYQKWSQFTQFMKNLAEAKKTNNVQNIIWEKSGLNSNKVLVVTAHYDTISHDKVSLLVNENSSMPGANYNASGVAVALGLIKILSEIDLNYSVQICFLDWQGIGFHGSELYAKDLKKSGKEVIGVVNLEMLGQDTSFFDKTKKNGNMSLYLRDLADEVRFATKLSGLGVKMTQKVSFEIKPNGFENSDNFRFWEEGLKAVTFSQNWEDDFNPKFYQTADDTPETLNHETLWHSYQYIGGAVIGTLLDLTK